MLLQDYDLNQALRRCLTHFKLAKICRAAGVDVKRTTDFKNSGGHVKLCEYKALCKHFDLFVWDPETKAAEEPFGAVQRRLRREKEAAEDLAMRFSKAGYPCTVRGVDDVACSKMTAPSTSLAAMLATYGLFPCKEDGTLLSSDQAIDAFVDLPAPGILEGTAA